MATTEVEKFIEGTLSGDQLLQTVYPEHVYDPVRRDMAVQIMGKELAKLIGLEGNEELERVRRITDDWFNGVEVTQTPVHDFWSTFELLPLVKTKRLARFITASNVSWEHEQRPLDDMTLTWMPYIESHNEAFGPGPWPIPALRAGFAQKPNLWQEAQRSNAANVAHYKFEHSQEPVTLVSTDTDEYFLDGNGRLYRAFMAGHNVINCNVGTMTGPKPVDYWVSTGLLKNLCYEIIDNRDDRPDVSQAAHVMLSHQLTTNAIARTNYELWLRKHFPQIDV